MPRHESDLIGPVDLPDDALWGIHTHRAMENFPLTLRPVHPALIHAYGEVKLACVQVNRELDVFPTDAIAEALERACRELADGLHDDQIRVDALQGGAGTSLNMNINEVLSNRALQILEQPLGAYETISPTDHVNAHQSTNDTFPTALKVAAIRRGRALETALVALQEAFQQKEKDFAHIVKVGRTEYQDAVLTTLGREMGAYAEAFNRDRWRVYKCEERLRVVNLGGTAIGTGLTAPRSFIFRATETLRENTGLGLARAENLVECTQNADVFAEVAGILGACAVSLRKIADDLRLLSSGPEAGLGEIRLPPRQAGSSIMPGKVNPVIPEAVAQVTMVVLGNQQTINQACASGSLELNPFLPLVADALLTNLDLLERACTIFRTHCVEGMEADAARCMAHVHDSTAIATALLPAIGYEHASAVVLEAKQTERSIRDVVLGANLLTEEAFDHLISPEAVCRLGMPPPKAPSS